MTATLSSSLFAASAPRVPHAHVFESGGPAGVLVVGNSQIYSAAHRDLAGLKAAMARADANGTLVELHALGIGDHGRSLGEARMSLPQEAAPTVHALSLAVAQKCNLGCTYCYARGGDFGGPAKQMSLETALAAVDLLLRDAQPGSRISLSFLGGEPLANRAVVRETTRYTLRQSAERRTTPSFAITTNGTLLTQEDADFFEEHGFAVTISLDGVGASHDRLRAFKDGRGSYERIMQNVRPLLTAQQQMQISARVTVTPRNLDLKSTLDAFVEEGFHTVGFSPMLASPTGEEQMESGDLGLMLEQMVLCGRAFEEAVMQGRRYPFLNMINAMKELHRGTHKPLPCGAGAGYLGVSAEGGLFACHRFVDDEVASMGSLREGVNDTKQNGWLQQRQVDRQDPCSSCWARYLCGGGCHHEVIHRGRTACDFIRGWLHYTLGAYLRLRENRPDYFDWIQAPPDA